MAAPRITYERGVQVMWRVHEEAERKRTLAGRLYTDLLEAPKSAKAQEQAHKRRGPVSPIGGVAVRSKP